jgi:hypothetical protein
VSLSEGVRPLLAAHTATDPNAARLLEMFTKADESLSSIPERQGLHKFLLSSGVDLDVVVDFRNVPNCLRNAGHARASRCFSAMLPDFASVEHTQHVRNEEY